MADLTLVAKHNLGLHFPNNELQKSVLSQHKRHLQHTLLL